MKSAKEFYGVTTMDTGLRTFRIVFNFDQFKINAD